MPAGLFRPGMPSIGQSINNRMHTGQSVYNSEAQCQLVCSDWECHLLAGLLTTECIPAGQFRMVKHNAGQSVQTGMPSIGRSVNNRMHTGQSVYNGEAQCQPVCSDWECHLLAGLLTTECIPAGQFRMVKCNAGQSVQTGNAIYWPVCQQQNAYQPVSLKW